MLDTISQVLTEVEKGQGISLPAAARLVPGGTAGHANPATVFRWTSHGAKAVDGRRVCLEHVRIGNRILTTHAAIRRFIAALSQSADAKPAPRSPAAARRASERANKQLQEMGC